MSIRTFILSFSLFFFSVSVLAGGGWPQPKGHGYVKLFQWWVIADQHFTDMGGIDPNTTNGIFNTGFYGEYGITNRITGVVYFPFFSRAYFNNTVSGTTGDIIVPGEAINSLGDMDLSLKYGLITQGSVVVSASLKLGLPLGNSSGGSTGNLQTGDGEFNQLLQVDASTSFKLGSLNSYASIYGGYNNRTNGFSDEVHFGAEAGVSFLKNKLTVIGRLVGIKSMKNGSLTDMGNSTSIFANNSEYISIAPELAYQFDEHWGVSAALGTAISGRIIFANPSYSVGVFYKW